ncbi:MAG: hypothetical protein NTW61_06875 [Candidatus Melainabacteria bacterium]|nr:hypothetical protein [Candidatus Melainabacteria bacterium]
MDVYHDPYLTKGYTGGRDYKEAFRLAKAHLFLHLLIPYSDELEETPNIKDGHLKAAKKVMEDIPLLLAEGTQYEESSIVNELRAKIDSLKTYIGLCKNPWVKAFREVFLGESEEMPSLNIPNL